MTAIMNISPEKQREGSRLTEGADVEGKEFLVLDEVDDVKTILDSASRANSSEKRHGNDGFSKDVGGWGPGLNATSGSVFYIRDMGR